MCGSSSITSTAPIALSCPPRGYARAGKRGVNRRSGPIEPAAPPSPAVQESLAMATTDQSMTASPAPSLPRLERHGSASQLLVDGRPFLVRGGEIGNSSGEPEYQIGRASCRGRAKLSVVRRHSKKNKNNDQSKQHAQQGETRSPG